MQDAFQRFLSRLPFPVLEIHPDNGSEFFPGQDLRQRSLDPLLERQGQGYATLPQPPLLKNGNRFVEQKNSTEVRAYVGYDRLDNVEQNNLLNQLYDKLWLPKVQTLPACDAPQRKVSCPEQERIPPRQVPL